MRKDTIRELRGRFWLGALALMLAVMFGLFWAVESHAESQGKVIAKTGAKIRKEPSTSSEAVGSAQKDKAVTVISKVQGDDGYAWYEVRVDNTSGYIRSNLITITDGSTPPEGGQTGGEPQPTEAPVPTEPPEPPVEPTPEPVIPSKPYDTIMQDGDWYLYDTETNQGYTVKTLLDSLAAVNTYGEMCTQLTESEKNQKIIIIVLVFLLVAAVAGIAFLVFKIKDMMDAAYFSEVENDTLRKKKAANQGAGQRITHTAADNSQARSTGAKPAGTRAASQGQRPSGSVQPLRSSEADRRPAGASQGQRPMGAPQGQRPAGAPQGQRPMGASQGQRPAGAPQGQRPMGAPQGQRPAGAPQGQRPMGAPQGQRPAGAPQGQRPMGTPQGQRPAGAPQSQRPAGAPQGARPASQEEPQKSQRKGDQQWQSKNFMADEEDEFEFEFLNYEEDSRQ